jgi:hypothetical protein
LALIAEEKIKQLDKEIMIAQRKLDRITFQDKASRVFLFAGIMLVVFGFIAIGLVYNKVISPYFVFLFGFLSTELLLVGYSLMHKSLRGAWL